MYLKSLLACLKCKSYKNEFWNENKAKRLFQKLLFHNILIEKPKIKGSQNIHLLHELPFYDELNIYKMSKAFGWYQEVKKLKNRLKRPFSTIRC